MTSSSVDDVEYIRAKRFHRHRVDLFSPPNCDVKLESDLIKYIMELELCITS